MSIGDIMRDVDEAARALGIEGYDELGGVEDDDELSGYDEVGLKKAVKRQRGLIRKMGSMIKVQPSWGGPGPKRLLPLPCLAVVPLAAAGIGNLTFTPNRKVEIIDATIEAYTLAATAAVMQQQAIHITNIIVEGRNLWPGAGLVPISAFSRDAVKRRQANEIALGLGSCESTQNIVFALVNNDAATAVTVVGTLWVICTP